MNKTVATKAFIISKGLNTCILLDIMEHTVFWMCECNFFTVGWDDRWVIVCSASVLPPIKTQRQSNGHIHMLPVESALCEWIDCAHLIVWPRAIHLVLTRRKERQKNPFFLYTVPCLFSKEKQTKQWKHHHRQKETLTFNTFTPNAIKIRCRRCFAHIKSDKMFGDVAKCQRTAAG